jgi:Recombinase
MSRKIPAREAVLAEIRRLRDSGTTLRGIARDLNHRTFRTRRGTAWRLESVAGMVKQASMAMTRVGSGVSQYDRR